MKTTKKTIKGWAAKTHYFAGSNVKDTSLFEKNFKEYADNHLNGFKRLQSYETLRGKQATEKVIIYGWYWRGAWSDPRKEITYIFYK